MFGFSPTCGWILGTAQKRLRHDTRWCATDTGDGGFRRPLRRDRIYDTLNAICRADATFDAPGRIRISREFQASIASRARARRPSSNTRCTAPAERSRTAISGTIAQGESVNLGPSPADRQKKSEKTFVHPLNSFLEHPLSLFSHSIVFLPLHMKSAQFIRLSALRLTGRHSLCAAIRPQPTTSEMRSESGRNWPDYAQLLGSGVT
jgi:hypothetical protein